MQQSTQQRLIIAGIMLVVLVGLIFGAQALGDREDTSDPTPSVEAQEPLFPEAAGGLDPVIAFSLTNNETGATIAAEETDVTPEPEPTDEGTVTPDPFAGQIPVWDITTAPEDSDTGLGVDTQTILTATTPLPLLTPTQALTTYESAAEFGLEEPQYTLEFQIEDGDVYTLFIGDEIPTGNGYYVQLPGDDVIYVVQGNSLNPILNMLEAPPYIQPTLDPNATPVPPTETPEPTEEPTEES